MNDIFSSDTNVTSASETATSGRLIDHPVERFFLLGNRLVVASLILVLALSIFFGLAALGDFTSTARQPLMYLFSALTGGNFTLITIIVSINQLVVSRQLGTPGELRQQIEETNEYRRSVIETLPEEHVAPVTPTEFLHLLLRATRKAINRLDDAFETVDDQSAQELLDGLVDDLLEHIDQVDSLLQQSDTGIFHALSATLTTNYSKHIYRARELQSDYADVLDEEGNDALDELVVLLQQIDVARQYLKSLYMQDELSRLSRQLLYVGVPGVFVSMGMLLLFAVSSEPVLSSQTLSLLAPVAATASVAPLAVVFSFVLRISSVSRRTVAITPFTTATQEL
ncbi:hypothetical protein [Haloarchaeobius sp. DFWS5]|uniref:hypothetical protein n=1 Tax=Haloarchaeobius sp. DFWS5 TaxID=3446114 RepID=UPI003EC1427C